MRVELEPLIAGGGHERGLRSGTENVAAIVGLGMACALAVERQAAYATHVAALRRRLEDGLLELGATVFAQAAVRLPNTVYFALPELDGETLVGQLDRAGYAVASGAACSSANPEPSHVLRAMGVNPELARGALRASLGAANTGEQVDGFLAALRSTVGRLQRLTAMAG
jgi:cysteine desulfurase